MKGSRESTNKGPPSTDLLVCFPTRAHLSLMPKRICSPSRPPEYSNRHKNLSTRASSLQRTKSKNSDISEPTSPKVTCAGQIKVRPNKHTRPCKNWQSVMDEIERLHNNRSKLKKNKNNKPANWTEALGFKKDVFQFLTCLRNIKFDFRCFGSFNTETNMGSDDEDEDDDDGDEDFQENQMGSCETSRTVFSKWFMVLQETQNTEFMKPHILDSTNQDEDQDYSVPCVPPANALLLMRCRSAPAKIWLDEEDEDEDEDEDEEKGKAEEEDQLEKAKQEMERLVVMRCGSDFYKLSSDIAKETWVVSGVQDPLSKHDDQIEGHCSFTNLPKFF